MLNNEYLIKLPKNKLLAANKICADFMDGELQERSEDVLLTLEVLLQEELPNFRGANSTNVSVAGVKITDFTGGIFQSSTIRKKIREIHRNVKALLARATITDPSMINMFLFELSDAETKRIDELLGDIRNIVRESTVISDEHKRRLLKVVNSLQAEVDKEYSDFRVFLDGMIEVSEAVGEAGENVKPVFDRIKEVFGIADTVRKAKEALEAPFRPKALPPPLKELPAPDVDEGDTEA